MIMVGSIARIVSTLRRPTIDGWTGYPRPRTSVYSAIRRWIDRRLAERRILRRERPTEGSIPFVLVKLAAISADRMRVYSGTKKVYKASNWEASNALMTMAQEARGICGKDATIVVVADEISGETVWETE